MAEKTKANPKKAKKSSDSAVKDEAVKTGAGKSGAGKKGTRMASVAFVESPLQFLSALESHEPTEDLLIRARASAKGMTSFLDAFDPAWLPKNVRLERDGAKPGLLRKTTFDRIYLGDACSGQVLSSENTDISDSFINKITAFFNTITAAIMQIFGVFA